jgi:hypothetical protein
VRISSHTTLFGERLLDLCQSQRAFHCKLSNSPIHSLRIQYAMISRTHLTLIWIFGRRLCGRWKEFAWDHVQWCALVSISATASDMADVKYRGLVHQCWHSVCLFLSVSNWYRYYNVFKSYFLTRCARKNLNTSVWKGYQKL